MIWAAFVGTMSRIETFFNYINLIVYFFTFLSARRKTEKKQNAIAAYVKQALPTFVTFCLLVLAYRVGREPRCLNITWQPSNEQIGEEMGEYAMPIPSYC